MTLTAVTSSPLWRMQHKPLPGDRLERVLGPLSQSRLFRLALLAWIDIGCELFPCTIEFFACILQPDFGIHTKREPLPCLRCDI